MAMLFFYSGLIRKSVYDSLLREKKAGHKKTFYPNAIFKQDNADFSLPL